MAEKAYKFRIYPSKEQTELIQKTFGCSRFVYNHYLSQRIEQYKETGKSPTRFQQDKDLTQLKRELEWLQEPDKWALQNSLKDLDAAYQNFFRGIRGENGVGFPKFKSKKNHRKSYRTSNSGSSIAVVGNKVKLPKLGFVKCAASKEVKGRILNATISQNPSGKYFVSLCCTDVDVEPLNPTGAVVGVDLGIKDLAITSDGIKFRNNKYLAASEDKLKKLQRRLSRKTRGSNRWNKQRIKVARLQEKIANNGGTRCRKRLRILFAVTTLSALRT